MKAYWSAYAGVAALAFVAGAGACAGSRGRAGPEPRELPVEEAPAPPPPIPAPVEANDEPLRYHPPAPSPRPPFAPPEPKEIRLANGARALLVERHQTPNVTVDIVISWKAAPPIPGLTAVLGSLFPEMVAPRSNVALRKALFAQGVGGLTYGENSLATNLRFTTNSATLGAAFDLIFEAIPRAPIPEGRIAEARERGLKTIEARSLRQQLDRAIYERLLPAGDRYRDPADGTKESLPKIDARALARYRDAELQPEIVTVCVAGDVTPGALTEALERSVGAWKSSARPAAERPPGKVASGAFWIALPDEAKIEIALAIPLPPSPDADITAALDASVNLFERRLRSDLQSRLTKPWRPVYAAIQAQGSRRFFVTELGPAPEEAGKAVGAALDAIDSIGKGDVTDEAIATERVHFLDWLEGAYDGDTTSVKTLTTLVYFGWTPDRISREYQAWQALRRDSIVKLAKEYFTREQVRIVGIGSVAEARGQVGELRFGPEPAAKPPSKGIAGGAKK